MSCYKFETDHYVRGRHIGGCDASECSGCQPCTENHCGECRKGNHLGHGENTCADCIARARADLGALLDLYAALPPETIARGVTSEAANLHGPVADAEALSHRRISTLAGRISAPLLEEDEHHPLAVLARWVFMLGEDYGEATDLTLTMSRAVDYIDRRLHRIAHDSGQDFGQFATELRTCRAHLEAVLHDQAMGDRANVGCFDCGGSLERRLTKTGFEDVWTCKGCRRRYTYAEYNFALRAKLEETA